MRIGCSRVAVFGFRLHERVDRKVARCTLQTAHFSHVDAARRNCCCFLKPLCCTDSSSSSAVASVGEALHTENVRYRFLNGCGSAVSYPAGCTPYDIHSQEVEVEVPCLLFSYLDE